MNLSFGSKILENRCMKLKSTRECLLQLTVKKDGEVYK